MKHMGRIEECEPRDEGNCVGRARQIEGESVRMLAHSALRSRTCVNQ
jgi:hypothetical protein